MKKNLFFAATMLIAGAMASCSQKEEFPAQATNEDAAIVTRAYGDKMPKVTIYVETNDVNPLNAGDYKLSDGTTYADIVEFFAANIHKETVGGEVRPTLYLNDKMTSLLENGGAAKYVKGLQDKGIKVLLTVLGDHKGIGVANMNDTQTTQLAQIMAYAVEKYGLDGIGFDDEYSDYSTSLISGSFGSIITKLRDLMPAGKLITVFQYGNIGSSQINATAGAQIDYVYSDFSYYNTYISVDGVTKEHYAPMSINLGTSYGSTAIRRYGTYAKTLTNEGYSSIMHFNLRRTSDVNSTSLFSTIATNAYGKTVTCENGDRAQDWTFVPSGYTITVDDVQ